MTAEPKIALEEWLAEMQRLSASSDEGLTATEWAKEMRVSKAQALERLRKAQASNWLRVGRRRTTALDGRVCVVPVYQIIKPRGGLGK